MFWSDVLLKRGVQIASTQCRFYRTVNPGVGRRLKIFKQDNPDLSQAQLTEKDFDESEVDIMNSSALVEEYERYVCSMNHLEFTEKACETRGPEPRVVWHYGPHHKRTLICLNCQAYVPNFEEHRKISKRIAFKRVEREYFDKTKSPNFLLWSEKEQIRMLHHSEPDKWTNEALSESFPAKPDVIKKIVKAQWKLKDPQAIKKHDDKVIANWRAFVKKRLELPPRIAEHLSKFTARERLVPSKESKDLVMLQEQQLSTQDKLVPTKSTQFIDIVRKHQKPDSTGAENLKNESTGDDTELMPSYPSETYVIGGKVPKRLQSDQYTLSEMKDSGVLSKDTTEPHATGTTETAANENVSVEAVTKSADSKKSKGVLNPTGIDSFSIPRYANAGSSVAAPNDELLEDVPMKITIPKKKWKKGAVYKVNNCFYADDGEFLYKI